MENFVSDITRMQDFEKICSSRILNLEILQKPSMKRYAIKVIVVAGIQNKLRFTVLLLIQANKYFKTFHPSLVA